MKILSDSAITRNDLDAVDAKQDRQIKQLRVLVAAVTVANIAFTLAAKFLF